MINKKQIEKLTPEQEALIPICRDYWISKGLQTGETDWDTFETNIKLAYEKSNISFPNKIIRVQSPLVGALAATISDRILNNLDILKKLVKKNNFKVTLNNKPGAVGGAVEDAVGTIIKSKKLQWHYWLGGQFWVGGWYWGTAFSSFFIDYCKLKLSDDLIERFNIYKSINESVNYIWCNKDFVIVCARPIMINKNLNNQLHSITQKSIEYPDGWGLYSFNGITIKEELFNQLINKTYTFEQWLVEKNEEIKSLVLAFYEEKFGGEFVFRFLSEYLKEVDNYVDKKNKQYLKGVIDSMNIGVYTLFKGSINNINISYVRCYCPSTDRMFFLGVHPDIKTAKDAIASLCQIPLQLKDELLSISRQGEEFSFNFTDRGTKMLKNKEIDFKNVVSLQGDEYFSKIKFEY